MRDENLNSRAGARPKQAGKGNDRGRPG